MLKIVASSLLLSIFFLQNLIAVSWTAGAEIPLGPSSGVSNFFGSVQDTAANQLIQVWQDSVSADLYYSSYNGTSWTTGAEIPLGTSTGVSSFLAPVYDTVNSQVIQIWTDSGTGNFLYYSTYNGTSWTTGAQIPPGDSSGSFAIVAPTFDPVSNQLVQIWLDAGTGHFLYYSSYNGSSWTTGAEIPPNTSTGVSSPIVSPVYDPASGQLVQVWKDTGAGTHLYYSSYNGSSWTSGAVISSGSSTVDSFKSPVYDSGTGTIIQVWQDSGTGNFLFYSSYNGSTWTTGAEIPPGGSTGVSSIVVPVYDLNSGQLIQVWEDSGSGNHLFYSSYNGSSWTSGAEIPPGASTGIPNFSAPIYDSGSNQLVQIWQNNSDGHSLYYSSYNGTSWTTGAEIPLGASSGVEISSFSRAVYNVVTGQLFQTWEDSGANNFPYYSIYDGTSWTSGAAIPPGTSPSVLSLENPVYTSAFGQLVQIWQTSADTLFFSSSTFPLPSPSGLGGRQNINNFGVVSERFNTLSWQQSFGVANYLLYRNGALIAVLDGTASSYVEHDQPKQSQTYTLTAMGQGSQASSSVVVGGNQ